MGSVSGCGDLYRSLLSHRTVPHPKRQLSKLRAGTGRLIDSYAEGVISKTEFEPRLAGLRQRIAELEAEATTLRNAVEHARSLHLVIGKLETFAGLVRDRLDEADWTTK